MGERIAWHPESMGVRYRDWTQNLQLDWCVSRQRYFGVPIPVWYPLDEGGRPDFARPLVAEPEQLPVDPMTATPRGYDEGRRGKPGGFAPDPDVFDTWFTSSMTPQIGSHWQLDPERHRRLYPADLRPQSHEIIRTWAFYTIAKSLLHEDSVPWRHVAISGWVLDPDRKKMSKSKGNVVTPLPMLERWSADGARYWSASARLGTDTAADEQVFKVGKRLVTKLFNAGKFVLAQSADARPIAHELDRAFVNALRELVAGATAAFARFNHAQALAETESFFWGAFTDTYLELAKLRARGEGEGGEAGRGSAVATLRLAQNVLLRLFAPFLPYICEEVWSWAFARESGAPSIHRAPWPGPADFAAVAPPASERCFERATDCWRAINKAKADASVSMGREVASLAIVANAKTQRELAPALADVLGAGRCRAHELRERDSLADGAFLVEDAVFAPREEREAEPTSGG
jgi:valyl-tRNA synthetase